MKYLPAAGLDFLSDRLIVGKLLKPLKGKMTVGQILKDVIKTGAAEGATEGAQQTYLNGIAAKLQGYDPSRTLDDEVLKKILFVVKHKDAFLGTVNKGGRPKLDKKELSSVDEPKEELPQPEETGNAFEIVSARVKNKLNGTK